MPDTNSLAAAKASQIEIIPPIAVSIWDQALSDQECRYARAIGLTDAEIMRETIKLIEFRKTKPGYSAFTWFDRAAEYKKRHPELPKSVVQCAREISETLRLRMLREGIDPDAPYVDHEAEAERVREDAEMAERARQRKENGPPWSGIIDLIRRKTFSTASNQASENFKRKSFERGRLGD